MRWESDQLLHIYSQGWRWNPDTNRIELHAGGEISARFINPTDPLGREDWPARTELQRRKGWRNGDYRHDPAVTSPAT